MTQTPWRSLVARALHQNRSLPHSRYVQLATVKVDGTPANRTIVFRGFMPQADHLQFVTDRRSDKLEEIKHQAIGQLCWYFPKSREQFRIGGKLHLITQDCDHPTLLKLRRQLWHNLSDHSRIQFAWPPPKQLRTEDQPAAFEPPRPDRHEPIDNFCALLLEPEMVDHLQLKGNPQQRTLFHRDQDQWHSDNVNP